MEFWGQKSWTTWFGQKYNTFSHFSQNKNIFPLAYFITFIFLLNNTLNVLGNIMSVLNKKLFPNDDCDWFFYSPNNISSQTMGKSYYHMFSKMKYAWARARNVSSQLEPSRKVSGFGSTRAVNFGSFAHQENEAVLTLTQRGGSMKGCSGGTHIYIYIFER